MKNFPLIVSYYTQDTLYQLEVQNLIASLEKWGLDYHVEPIATLGSWERNCAFKPFFLYEKLEQFERPLFWVDADAVFESAPQYLEVFSADIAVRINEELSLEHPSKVMSGSLFVNATEGAKRVVKAWAKLCLERISDPARTEEVWDQAVLRDILFKHEHQAKIGALPRGYTAIVGNPHDEREIHTVTIAHYQASRRLKKTINLEQ